MLNSSFFGNGYYCYANSVAMLLASVGEQIFPSLIEVVSGVGIGAFMLPNSNICFLSGFSGLPDKGITRALTTLGFKFKECAQESPHPAPIEQLQQNLVSSPVIVGPLDMGYLTYNPSYKQNGGVDHFVLIYSIQDNEAFLHDPAGFPNVTLSLDSLALAWKAESIVYKEGYYRCWHSPKRIASPSDAEMYNQSIQNFQELYVVGEKYAKKQHRMVDVEAINSMANNIEAGKLTPAEKEMLTGFVFPVSARRSSDYADFFVEHHQELSALKLKQSKIVGHCQSLASQDKWQEVSDQLRTYAEVEQSFKQTVLELQ